MSPTEPVRVTSISVCRCLDYEEDSRDSSMYVSTTSSQQYAHIDSSDFEGEDEAHVKVNSKSSCPSYGGKLIVAKGLEAYQPYFVMIGHSIAPHD